MKKKERHAKGALIGTCIGEILGMPIKGSTCEGIIHTSGSTEEVQEGFLAKGRYSENIQMMMALAHSLNQNESFDVNVVVQSFIDFYDEKRGNGGAVRIAPVSIFYANQKDQLIQVAEQSAAITHSHPIGIEGAVIQACAVALAYRYQKVKPFPVQKYINKLQRIYKWSPIYQEKLDIMKTFLDSPPDTAEVIQRLGNSVCANESVITAIYSFLMNNKSFRNAVCYAVNLGGDATSIGAMTGALAGAYHGLDDIPTHWLEQLYNGKQEKDDIENLGAGLVKKHTIAIVSPGLFSVPPVIGSSVEHDIEMVAKELQKKHHVIVYTCKCTKYPYSSKEGKLEYRRFSYKNSKQYLKCVIKDLKKSKPDLIQIENRPQYITVIKRNLPKTPIILSMHSMQYASHPFISRSKAMKSLQKIDALLTNSFYLQKQYEKRFPFLIGKAFGVHLGIDVDPYEQGKIEGHKVETLKKKFNISEHDKVLLFVGRIKRDKGVHHLINALPKVLKENSNVKLLITGSPRYGKVKPTPYLQQIQNETRALKDKVQFTNFIKPYLMPYIYQLADVVVTPSVWGEPFCRVNLEGMSARKPIVTTKRGGIPEVVKDRENGYVLSLKNISTTLPSVLVSILRSDLTRKRLGKAGYKRAKMFTWEKTAKGYLDVYEKVFRKRGDL